MTNKESPGAEPGLLFARFLSSCSTTNVTTSAGAGHTFGRMANIEHEFGGQHTELKLSVVEKYLQAFSTALHRRFPGLIYIDAFAGTGSRTVRVEAREGNLFDEPVQESVEQRRGSAQIAIGVSPPFTKLIFIEQNERYCTALRELKASHSERDIVVVEGDANLKIKDELKKISWSGTRAVLFLDPYGMEVEWSTLEAIAATRSIDLWFLFSLSGLYRQATRDKSAMDADKRAAITRMLGTNAWENELYSKPEGKDLFGEELAERRTADVRALELYVKRRLEVIFPKVFDPLRLPQDRGPQRYSLFFALSNNDPRAIGLATRIANYILKAGISS